MKERKLKIGAAEINFAEGPKSGPPLILSHGFPGHWQEFMPILPALSMQWHVHAVDLRGQGKSGWIPNQYQAKNYLADIVEFIRHQVAEPVVLLGQSASGLIVMGAAAAIPELVKGVIIGDSPIDIEVLTAWMTSAGFKHRFSALQQISGLKHISVREIADKIADIPTQVPGKDIFIRYGEVPGVDPIKIQELAIVLHKLDPGVLDYHATGRASELLEGFDFESVLEKVKCPVLLVQANPSLGGMMTDNGVKFVKSKVSDVEHVLLESCGHSLGLDNWEIAPLLRVIVSFMSSFSFQ